MPTNPMSPEIGDNVFTFLITLHGDPYDPSGEFDTNGPRKIKKIVWLASTYLWSKEQRKIRKAFRNIILRRHGGGFHFDEDLEPLLQKHFAYRGWMLEEAITKLGYGQRKNR